MSHAAPPPFQFKAGRCNREGNTNVVKPDPTKGLVYMEEDDGLLHFYWKDRTTNNNAEDLDLILFPDDAELVHVPQCSTGRVVMLQFKSSPQKHFFWLQDKNTDRDQIILQQTNALINQGQRLGDDDDTGHFDDDVRME